jgi:hypothetical protein
MLVSHCPVENIEELNIDFHIYDRNNEFLPAHYTPFFWLNTAGFRVEIYNAGHTLPICRNMRNALTLARGLGYETFLFTEADVILGGGDFNRLNGLLDTMEQEHKKMLFFRPEQYRDCGGSYVYETLLFGGSVSFFLETFKPPINLEQWLAIPMGYTLELSFYEQFSREEDKFLLVNDHSSNYLTESQVNVLRYGLFNCEIVYNERNPESATLFIMNSLVSGKPMHVSVLINSLMENLILHQNQFWVRETPFDESSIYVFVYEDENHEKLFLEKTFQLTGDPITFKNKGLIKYN